MKMRVQFCKNKKVRFWARIATFYRAFWRISSILNVMFIIFNYCCTIKYNIKDSNQIHILLTIFIKK